MKLAVFRTDIVPKLAGALATDANRLLNVARSRSLVRSRALVAERTGAERRREGTTTPGTP